MQRSITDADIDRADHLRAEAKESGFLLPSGAPKLAGEFFRDRFVQPDTRTPEQVAAGWAERERAWSEMIERLKARKHKSEKS